MKTKKYSVVSMKRKSSLSRKWLRVKDPPNFWYLTLQRAYDVRFIPDVRGAPRISHSAFSLLHFPTASPL